MTNALAYVFQTRSIVPYWTWRDRKGNRHEPSQMETRHLFYVLRMIWNHTTPSHMHVGTNIHYYQFDPKHYPTSYMRDAVWTIGGALLGRKDLTAAQKSELNEIAMWVLSREYRELNEPRLQKPTLRLEHSNG